MERIALPDDDITAYGSSGVRLTAAARSSGEATVRVHVAHIGAKGVLGRHPTPVWQLLCVISGTGWVTGDDNHPQAITAGQAVVWAPGEHHESGSDTGMTALIVQTTSRAIFTSET